MRRITIALILLSLVINTQARQILDLPGFVLAKQATTPNVHTEWTYVKYNDVFFKDDRFAPYRTDSTCVMPYFLTPQNYYLGEESRIQLVQTPADWKDKVLTLELERVHVISHVYVNGVEAQSLSRNSQVGRGCRSLGAPHKYDLTGLLRPGNTDTLRISIDNRLDSVPVGNGAYSVSDNDQGNWNGYIGRAQITAQPTTRLLYDATQVHPDVDAQQATVRLQMCKRSPKPEKVKLRLQTEAGIVEQPFVLVSDSQSVQVQLSGLTRLWSDKTPNLYHLRVQLLDKKGRELDAQQLQFGMRQVSTDQHFVLVNGERVYLQGTVDGAQFPMTGYPPMDVPFWVDYFQKLKEWGTNLVRFHSWCPPEAAFIAADSVGMYLQPEGSVWPNHNIQIRRGDATEQFIWEETDQILRAYGNHPSFLLMGAGNEPKGKGWISLADEWVERMKERDPRHLYYAFAVGGSWPWTNGNQVQVRAGYRGVDWDRRRPESTTDFNAALDTFQVPFIGHEVGQWGTFPKLNDIPKFTGFMQSGHSIICRDLLAKAGMAQLADSFLLASGRLQVLAYKSELERIRRTRNYAGYNLQALLDYTGQGTANEGILNIFADPKGYIAPDEWKQWAGEIVVLMRTSRFTYIDTDTLRFALELSNMSREEHLLQQACSYRVVDDHGKVLVEKQYPVRDFVWGGCQTFANEQIPLADLHLTDATQLRLEVRVGEYHNQWNLWVYPSEANLNQGDVYVTTVPDPKARQILASGGTVLMLAHDQINMGRNIKQNMLPEFWNPLFMNRYSSHTHGLLIRDKHPLFRHFPTSYHSDVQWWELVNRTYPIWLEDLPEVTPIVQTIDDAYCCRRMGSVIEVRVGPGRLLITNFDLQNRINQRPAARQFLSAILQYMQSDEFQPAASVSFEQIYSLFANFKHMQL